MAIFRGSLIGFAFAFAAAATAQDNRPTVDAIYTKLLDDTNVQGIAPQFAHGVVNDYGQVIITGYFSRGARSGNGIYIADQFGFRKVIEEGDALDGGVVQSLAATPAMDGPNGYFLGSSVVGFAATIRVGNPGQPYFGFYQTSGSRSNRTLRLARQQIGSYGTFNCSADGTERGNWAFSAQAPDGRFSAAFGTRTSATTVPAPITFTAHGHAYNLIGADMIKADQSSLGGAYLSMTGQPTEFGLNQQSGILSLAGGSPSLFSNRAYQLPFKAGSGLIGGVSYQSGVPQMTVSRLGSISIRDNGVNHFETAQGFQMNPSGVTTNTAYNYTTFGTDLLWSNARGLAVRPNSNVSGPAAINAAGNLAYPWNNYNGTPGLEIDVPVQPNHYVSGLSLWRIPELLQVGQPLFGDYLYSFRFEPTRNFNKYNEVVVRYMLTNGQTGLLKAKLDVPIVASYDARFDSSAGQTVVTVTGDNFNPANLYQILVRLDSGAEIPVWLLPTADPRVWKSMVGDLAFGTAFSLNVEKYNGDYGTPTVRLTVH